MSLQIALPSNDLAISLFDNIQQPVVLFESNGALIYLNQTAKSIESKSLQQLVEKAIQRAEVDQVVSHNQYSGRVFSHGNQFGMALEDRKSVSDNFDFQRFVLSLRTSENVFAAAASEIQRCLNWRWVAITQFTLDQKLEVLSYLENQKPLEKFTYDLVGTPCKAVVESQRYTVFEDVVKAFPNYAPLQEAGIVNFAGLVYTDEQHQPIGHVLAMHDSSDVDYQHAKEVIELATQALSAHFCLNRSQNEMRCIAEQAHSDSLTGIGNRASFDQMMKSIELNGGEWTIAMIDLDRLKPLNDSKGHQAGDKFIQLVAAEISGLARHSDFAYRIGGDEFALLFQQDATPFFSSLEHRFDQALRRISQLLKFTVSASIGFSVLSETSGDISRWLQLADQRMYQQKNIKRLAS